MASDDSIRPEASTVHRGPEVEPESGVASAETDEQQLVQAETVIRGSSRAEGGSKRIEPMERSPASVAKVLLGTRLNHFFLEELIGGGGMGAVFRARDEQLDRVVAIKVIPFVGDDPDLQRRFRNEAQSAAKLDHPRIARVFDVGSYDDWHYIVFEYIRGTNIRDLVLSGGVLRIDDAVFYTCQLAAAIQHAADRGIVHRDIKPSNVLIGEEDKIKLVDMGLARSENFELSEDMTASGVTLGTFDYISPEQARDPRDADFRSDIYSLGCTLYFMLTGSPPYPGGTMLQKLLSHGNAPPPDARELREEVSDELMAVIQKMLAKSPDDRYQSAADLIADLREVAFRDGLVRTQAVGPVAVREPSPLLIRLERHAPWLVAMMLLVVTAGWLHLNSLASREDVTIPGTAKPLVPMPVIDTTQDSLDAAEVISPTGDVQQPLADDSMSAAAAAQDPIESLAGEDTAGDRPLLPELSFPNVLTPEGNEMAAVLPAESLGNEPSSDAMVSLEPLETGELPGRIRVLGPDAPLEYDRDIDGAQLTASLEQALELAEQFEVDHVEIAVPILRSDPVVINHSSLRITSNVPGGSVVIFEPDESITMERSNMFSIGSSHIEFEDIHFIWQVPNGEINGGALFSLHDDPSTKLNENPSVRLTDCSVTIANPGLCEEVYALDVVTDPEKTGRSQRGGSSREDETLPLVLIEMNNVIVRGQIGMIHMDYAVELRLNWENGLLAISEHMIDSGGARALPAPTARPMQLWLTRLTASTPKGLLRMRVGDNGAYPLSVDRFAQSSVFVVAPRTAHFEFSGLPSLSADSSPLQIRGMANAYDTDPTLADPMMVVSNSEGESEMIRLNSLPSRWPQEISPQWSVEWSDQRRADVPPSRLTAADFKQDGSARSGFNEKLLPILPVIDADGLGNSRDSASETAPAIGTEL